MPIIAWCRTEFCCAFRATNPMSTACSSPATGTITMDVCWVIAPCTQTTPAPPWRTWKHPTSSFRVILTVHRWERIQDEIAWLCLTGRRPVYNATCLAFGRDCGRRWSLHAWRCSLLHEWHTCFDWFGFDRFCCDWCGFELCCLNGLLLICRDCGLWGRRI